MPDLPARLELLTGLCLALLLALAVVHRELLRRAFLRAEDPRTLGALRLAFTAVALVGVLEPVVDARWLFSDEGLLLPEAARELAAPNTFAGLADGRLDAAWYYLTAGDASPLHFVSTPTFVAAYCGVLLLALLGLLVGLRTRACAWLVLVLYLGLLHHDMYWAGGEQVYCAGFFLLAVSRCDHAYSLDNWLRCRALARRGRLSTPGGPGDGAGTPELAAIYRRIPAWPRLLAVAQVALAYGLNGINKTGSQWWDGTALYYIVQGDWARLDVRPLAVSLAPGGISLATWFVRAWETLFPLVVLGLVLRFLDRERLPRPRGALALWLALAVVLTLLAAELAAHHPRIADVPAMPARVGLTVALASLALLLHHRLPRARLLLARRLWLGAGACFTLGLVALLNVGAFPLATFTLTLAMFRGDELAALFARLRRRPAIPCEDPTLPHLHHDDAVLPRAPLLLAVAALFAIAVAVAADVAPPWVLRDAALAAALALLAWPSRPVRTDMSIPPWAYGPRGRRVIGSVCAVHLTAYLTHAIPAWPDLDELRTTLRRPTRWWLDLTGNYQFWAMFSGSSDRNTALETLVVDADGREHLTTARVPHDDLALWNHRRAKLEGNVLSGKAVARWHARAECRRFAREHAGRTPQQVRLTKLSAPILPPSHAVDPGRRARFLADATRHPILTIDCPTEPHAQLPDRERQRHALPAEATFIPLTSAAAWSKTRDPLGPAWPYDELLALLALVLLARRRLHAPRPPTPGPRLPAHALPGPSPTSADSPL